MVWPNGPFFAASSSMWIHWWSSVASAKELTRAWSTSSHSLGPRRTPTCSWSFSLRSDMPIPSTSLAASCQSVTEGHAAVHDQRLAGDPRRVVAEQERGCLRRVSRDTEALHRVGRRNVVLAPFVQRAGERRLDHG